MTGELFAVLKGHSILGRLMAEGPTDDDAFARGVALGLDGKGLLGRLFSARTLPLTAGWRRAGVADYLSGLLIGTEIAEAERTGSGGRHRRPGARRALQPGARHCRDRASAEADRTRRRADNGGSPRQRG